MTAKAVCLWKKSLHFVIFPSSSGLELSLGMTTTLLLYFLSVPSYAAIQRTTAGYKKMLSILADQ
jgi:hypothetical protein